MTSATTAVTDSKAAKTKQDAIDQARTSLRNAIDTAQELLDGSLCKVSGNGHARAFGKCHQHRTGTDRRQRHGPPRSRKTPTDNETTNNQSSGSGEQPKPDTSADTPKEGASEQSE